MTTDEQVVKGIHCLVGDDETMDDLTSLSPEDFLLRWFNYHLEKAGCSRRVDSFSDDEIRVIFYEQRPPFDTGYEQILCVET